MVQQRLTRQERSEETRRLLLEAARTVFLRQGFNDTSLDQVATEAGFTKGAVYSQFASKADLFLTLLEVRVEQRVAEIEALSRSLAVGDVLTPARQWAVGMRGDPTWNLLVIEFRLYVARHPEWTERYQAIASRLRAAIAKAAALQLERRALEPTMPFKDYARASMAFANGMALEWAMDGDAVPADLYERVSAAMTRQLAGETNTGQSQGE
jgi:AcrR family transcriptional regulator